VGSVAAASLLQHRLHSAREQRVLEQAHMQIVVRVQRQVKCKAWYMKFWRKRFVAAVEVPYDANLMTLTCEVPGAGASVQRTLDKEEEQTAGVRQTCVCFTECIPQVKSPVAERRGHNRSEAGASTYGSEGVHPTADD
jgi:hypothetical protein